MLSTTLSMAVWLLSTESLGLDNTLTLPKVSSKLTAATMLPKSLESGLKSEIEKRLPMLLGVELSSGVIRFASVLVSPGVALRAGFDLRREILVLEIRQTVSDLPIPKRRHPAG